MRPQPVVRLVVVAAHRLASLSVRFIPSTWPLVHGWFGSELVIDLEVGAGEFEGIRQRNGSPAALLRLMSADDHVVAGRLGEVTSVKWWRFRCIPLRASVRLPAL